MIARRGVLGGGIACVAAPLWARQPERDISYAQDFDEMWRTLAERYCFFGEKATDWEKVRSVYRPQAIAAPSRHALAQVLKRALAELYDPHTTVRNSPDGTARTPPFDLMVARAADGIRVTAVQAESAAAEAGIAIGDVLTAIEGVPAEAAIQAAALRCLKRQDPAADAFVLGTVAAGRRGMPRRFAVRSGDAPAREIALPIKQRADPADVAHRRLENGIGLITIRSFGALTSVVAVDAALVELRDAPALLIDVRGNGGGDTAVARPIMGRFITERAPYAYMRRRAGAGLSRRWTEYVEPRGPFTWTKPVIVLCDHWSASMAEGFPMGMRGLGRATIVGTPMMGLGAAVFQLRLDRSGIDLQYSAEPVYDVQDRPRWTMRPDVVVPDGADILAAGVAEAKRRKAQG
ncbi:S41 family peptidase [Sphingomonas koreensis]|uniref:S41 family peptidase n=1 Tax=Sphingomonas koreensis TaxID=93064 RepID=UPI0019D126C8|nr:S41 family peptidase [Sphingomonas koreensis]